jgi:UDP-2,3-diacylglucosamine hydrolase
LCTDDIGYQRFRKIIRNPILLGFLKRTPLSFRQKLANGFRKKSSETTQLKSYDIMDVNTQAVESVITPVDYLIHGHTHRPDIHHVLNKQRIVLGDWRADSAWVLEINPLENNPLDFKQWTY